MEDGRLGAVEKYTPRSRPRSDRPGSCTGHFSHTAWLKLCAQYKLPRKEVIQPQLPLRLPCYDLVPIAEFIFGAWLLAVTSATSDAPHFRGLTGGVYKAQEHIHRGMLTRDY